MVTFISPQHGLPKAPAAKAIVGWEALDDLTPGSAFLEAVNNAPLPANVRFTSIYTCTDEYIQPYETSIIPGAKNIGLCDGFVGHYSVLLRSEDLPRHARRARPPRARRIRRTPLTRRCPPIRRIPAQQIDAGGCSTGGGSTTGLSFVIGAFIFAVRRRRRV